MYYPPEMGNANAFLRSRDSIERVEKLDDLKLGDVLFVATDIYPTPEDRENGNSVPGVESFLVVEEFEPTYQDPSPNWAGPSHLRPKGPQLVQRKFGVSNGNEKDSSYEVLLKPRADAEQPSDLEVTEIRGREYATKWREKIANISIHPYGILYRAKQPTEAISPEAIQALLN